MITYIGKQRKHPIYRMISGVIAFTFIFSVVIPPSNVFSQVIPTTTLNLPVPGSMVLPSQIFNPAIIKGVTIDPDNPLQFDFIIDKGETTLQDKDFEKESEKLIKYFMAALTVPEEELWVNLSPYEANRVIPQHFGVTKMGRDLLAQDYLLKQLTASLMNPDDDLGGEFWNRVHTKAYEKFGTTEIPMNTFNKIWIVPQRAEVYEHSKGAFVVDSHLKVMLEEDYLALQSNANSNKHGLGDMKRGDLDIVSGVSSAVIKEVLIPEIEKEVNTGKTFANLRQIYNSVILATWYKQAFKETILGQVYIDQSKTKGLEIEDKLINQKIYDQYVEAFEKGVYNYIKEDYDPTTQKMIPRKYFSGGAAIDETSEVMDVNRSEGDLNSSIAGIASPVIVKAALDPIEKKSSPILQLSEEDIKKTQTTVSLEKEFSQETITVAKENTFSIISAIEKVTDEKVIIDDLTVVGSSKLQPMPLVIHPNDDGELSVQRLASLGNLVIPRSDEEDGTVMGVRTVGDYISRVVRLTAIIPNGVGDFSTFEDRLKSELAKHGVIIRSITGTSMIKKQDRVVVDNESISVRQIEGVGSRIDMYVWYQVGKKIETRPPTGVEGAYEEVSDSLMEPSKFSRRPKLDRPIRVGINGAAGATGSAALRAFLLHNSRDQIEIIGVNGARAADIQASLRTDSTHGPLLDEDDITEIGVIGQEEGVLAGKEYWKVTIGGVTHKIITLNRRGKEKGDIGALSWKDLGVDIVFDATTVIKSKEGLLEHIRVGAKRAVKTAPSKADDFTPVESDGKADFSLLIGVNDEKFPEDKDSVATTIDCASCTTNNVVPALFVFLSEKFGKKWDIESVDILTVHAITGSQPILDRRPRTAKNLGATQNMILTSTGAAKATIPILPELNGKMSANSIRINSPDGSFTVLKSIVQFPEEGDLTSEMVNQRFRDAANSSQLKGILAVDDLMLSTAQLIGRSESSIVITEGTRVQKIKDGVFLVTLVVGYDNEWGYSTRLTDAAYIIGAQLIEQEKREAISSPIKSKTPDPVMLGDQWGEISFKKIKTVRNKYLKILKQNDAVTRLEELYTPLLERYTESLSHALSSARREQLTNLIEQEVEQFKETDQEAYKKAMAAAIFLDDLLGFDGIRYVFGKLKFLDRFNPLFNNSALEYFTLKGLSYSDPESKELQNEINKTLDFDISLYNPSQNPQYGEQILDPSTGRIYTEYRVLMKNDKDLLTIYLHDMASKHGPMLYSDLQTYLESAAFAVSGNLDLAEDYIFGIIPIIKASEIAMTDKSFIETQMSVLLNSKNIDQYRYAIIKLLESIPAQKRAKKGNPFRYAVMEIDERRERQEDIFRYLRATFHKGPGAYFLTLLEDLFIAIHNETTEEFFRETMDEEGRNIFLNKVQLKKFHLWEVQIKLILEEADAINKARNIDQLLKLSSSEWGDIISRIDSIDESSKQDWEDLVKLWVVAEETYSFRRAAVAQQDDLNEAIAEALSNKTNLWNTISIPASRLLPTTDYFERRHLGEVNIGYKGYNGLDATYKEGKFKSFVQISQLSVQIAEWLSQLSQKLKKGFKQGEDAQGLVVEARAIIVHSLKELEFRGLLTEKMIRVIPTLEQEENIEKIFGILNYLDFETMKLFDFFNDKIRNGSHIASQYYRSGRYQKYTGEDKNGNHDDYQKIAEEKLLGDLLAEEEILGLFMLAIIDLKSALTMHQELGTVSDVHQEVKDIKPLMLSGENPILPAKYGSKLSNLQIMGEKGVSIPAGGGLPVFNGKESLERKEEIIQATVELISSLEKETGKKFPLDSKNLDPKSDLLFVSARGGSFLSMPGMLNTVLNIGFNDDVVTFMIENGLGSKHFVLDSYRRFLNYYGQNVLNMRDGVFVEIIDEMKKKKGDPNIEISEFTPEDYEFLIHRYKEEIYHVVREVGRLISLSNDFTVNQKEIQNLLIDLDHNVKLERLFLKSVTSVDFDMDLTIQEVMPWLQLLYSENLISQTEEGYVFDSSPFDMLVNSILTTYRSWGFPEARYFRKRMKISDSWGTGASIIEMKFGNKGKESGTAVIFTHNALTGEIGLNGSYKSNAQGEDIVGGRTRHIETITDLKESRPELFEDIKRNANLILKVFHGEPQDIESTNENGEIDILQAREMDIVLSESEISPTTEIPFTEGEGQSGVAVTARFVFLDGRLEDVRSKIRRLRTKMDSKGEENIGIVLIGYYLTPEESVLLLDKNVLGTISSVQGGSAHATLVGRRNHKLVISGVSSLERKSGGYFMNGQELNEGLEGEIYTLDGNSKAISPNGGKIFKGKLEISHKKNNGDIVDGAGISSSVNAPIDVPGGIDLNPNNMNLQIQGKGFDLQLPRNSINLQNILIDGFTPVIMNVAPITNIQLLLSISDESNTENEPTNLGYRLLDPLEKKDRLQINKPQQLSLLN